MRSSGWKRRRLRALRARQPANHQPRGGACRHTPRHVLFARCLTFGNLATTSNLPDMPQLAAPPDGTHGPAGKITETSRSPNTASYHHPASPLDGRARRGIIRRWRDARLDFPAPPGNHVFELRGITGHTEKVRCRRARDRAMQYGRLLQPQNGRGSKRRYGAARCRDAVRRARREARVVKNRLTADHRHGYLDAVAA
jgi:hypothetical protein